MDDSKGADLVLLSQSYRSVVLILGQELPSLQHNSDPAARKTERSSTNDH